MAPLLDPSFARNLGAYGVRALERDPCVIYGLFPDFRLGFVNDAFCRFWRENDGAGPVEQWDHSRNLLSAIKGPLRDFYAEKLTEAMRAGQSWAHEYECHSPLVFRRFRMEVLPLPAGAGALVVNSRIEERPHYMPALRDDAPDTERYLRPDGFILQCSNCRRVRVAESEPPRWDWVPAFVSAQPGNVSHGICRLCVGYYYGEYVTPATVA